MSEVTVRRGREGSRWINERPTSHEVAEWFKTVPLHEGMDHEKYVGGITLIPGKEKGDAIVGYGADDRPIVAEVTDMTFTPYMKVETRVAYFHDYVRERGGGEYVGVIEPVAVPGSTELGLPDGFFAYRATHTAKGEVKFVGARFRVRMTTLPDYVTVERIGGTQRQLEAITLLEGVGTKIVATATKWDVDANALMKAETGAIGRALGVAGMLVLPGSGIATAEDMLEAMGPAPGANAEAAALPGDDTAQTTELHLNDDQLRERAGQLLEQLGTYPEALAAFRDWAKSRGHSSLASITSPALKGFVRKLERDLDHAQHAAQHAVEADAVKP